MSKRKKRLPKAVQPRKYRFVTWKLIPILVAALAALLVWVIHPQRHSDSVRASASNAEAPFAPTLVNRSSIPGERPAGMEWIPGASFPWAPTILRTVMMSV